MLKVLLGVAIGYVLGARAGRERYELIERTYRRVAELPVVRDAASTVRTRVEAQLGTAKPAAGPDGHAR